MLQYKLYYGWFEGFHIAIHCIVLQENHCIAIVSRLAWCIAIHCWKVKCIAIDIVLQAGKAVCHDTILYCDWGSWVRLKKIVSQYKNIVFRLKG